MGEKSLRGRIVVLLVLVALVFQSVSIVSSEEQEQKELYGGTLRVALKSEVTEQDLNPLSAVDDDAWQVIDLLYDSLARLKTGTNNSVLPEPWLAESWTAADDDTVNVKLRPGLKWHDMTNVTADDVVYSFNSSSGMKSSLKYGEILTGLSVIKIDDSNVQFNLSNYENKGWFFTRVLTIPMIPKDFDSGDDENGCGPYKFKSSYTSQPSSTSDEFIILEAKGDETHASMKYRFVQPNSFKASMDNETLNDVANEIEKINRTTGLANLSYGMIDFLSERVYRNGALWGSSNYIIDYAAGQLTLANPSSFDFDNEILSITYSPSWNEGQNYTVDADSGSIKIFNSVPTNAKIPVGTNLTSSYTYVNKSLTIESFDDYFYRKSPYNRGPYLDEILYRFYPDNPDTRDYDESADKAIIDLILRNVDVIGFGLTSIQVSGDRYLDVENGVKTKLSDEVWKTVESFATEAEANDYMRLEEGTFRKKQIWNVEENLTGMEPWPVVETFETIFDANSYINDTANMGRELRAASLWLVQEFFLALDNNPGFNVLYVSINTQRTPLNDMKFRLALANLTDSNTYYNLIGTDKEIGHSPVIPQNAYWYNESIPIYKLEHYPEDNAPILAPVNLQLDLADYKDVSSPSGTGSDGFRDLPDESQFNMTLQVPDIATSPSGASIGQTMLTLLNQVGINTTIHYDTWENIEYNVSINNFDLAFGILETDIDPYFLYDSFHSSEIGMDLNATNFNNYIAMENIVNETLHYDTIRIDEMTNMTDLAKSNLFAGSEMVYRNDTIWPPSNYDMDYKNGTLTITNLTGWNPDIDRLNITYDYNPFDHLLERANHALGFENRQGFVRDALSVAARHVPMIPLVYFRILEAYDRTAYDGWVDMLGGINNFWSYIGVSYIPEGDITVDVNSNTKTLKSNQTATIIVTTTDQEGVGVGGVYLQLQVLDNLGTLIDVDGYTQPDGSFSTKYTSPVVTDVTDVMIIVEGTVERYFENEGVFSLTIYPDLDDFLTGISRESTTIESDEETGITLTVTSDETGLPVPNANVTIQITPSDLDSSVESYQGTTDSTGTFITRFTASVTTETFFRITAKVSKDGFNDGEISTSVKAIPIYETEPPAIMGIAEISLIALVVALLIIYLLLSQMWKPKKPVAKEEAAKTDVEEEPKEEGLDTEKKTEEGAEEAKESEDKLKDEERGLEEEELKREKTDSE